MAPANTCWLISKGSTLPEFTVQESQIGVSEENAPVLCRQSSLHRSRFNMKISNTYLLFLGISVLCFKKFGDKKNYSMVLNCQANILPVPPHQKCLVLLKKSAWAQSQHTDSSTLFGAVKDTSSDTGLVYSLGSDYISTSYRENDMVPYRPSTLMSSWSI